MGTSNWQNISYNLQIVKKLNPKSILDIGVGFGRWGILFREILEIWGDNNYSGNWNRLIEGVEIFPEYIKEYHKYFYNKIYIENALDFIKKTDKKYDLINCGDVIEHFEKKDAVELIDICLFKSKYLLINIPIGKNWEQGAVNNNEYERHRSVWQNSDFFKYDNSLISKFQDVEYRNFSVILLSKNKINFNEAFGKYFKLKSILKNKLGLTKVIDIPGKRKTFKTFI